MTTEAKWSDFTSLDRAKSVAAANSLLPSWLSLALVIIIAWQLAKIIWTLVPGASAGDTVLAPAADLARLSASDTAADVQAIADSHLFGIASGNSVVAQEQVVETDNLRDTNLSSLALKGTIASDVSEMSIAIIADGSNDEKVYTVGSPVAFGATLHAVYADRVVLNEKGVLTNLKLPKDFPAGTPTRTRRNTTTSARSAVRSESLQAVVAQNVSKLADVIRPTPYFVNGQQQGYRVYPGRDRAQFAALGLRPGDLVKDIDGQSLTDPSQAMQVFQSLGSADQVSVTVERNGQPEVIVLTTSQLELGDELKE
jgi:general secretion pathway protein C